MNSNSEELLQSSDLEKPLSGRYKVVSELGEGGFCQTFLAEDIHLPGHPRCVVKQLNPHFETEEELQTARRLFDTEANVLYQLGNHDQIPRLLAHFEYEQKFYLVQELIDGTPLDQLFAGDQAWNEAEVIAFLKDLLQVLIFVHEQGVIHRDIKPSNLIRRQQDGRIVLIDFGAVKQVGAKDPDFSGKTDLTISIGTQGYTPSEQLAGNPHFSSDIYAVGMVAIRALTNTHPKQLKRNPRTNELEWQAEGISVCPELTAVLDRMVRYDFRQRYSTVDEAFAALWWGVPAYLLDRTSAGPANGEASSDLPSQEALAAAGYSSQRSPSTLSLAELPTLRQVFSPSSLRRWMLPGGLAVAGLTVLLATSLPSFRIGGLWSNQHLNPDSASPVSPAATATPPATASPGQDSSTSFSKPDGFASLQNVPSGLFNYGGSTTWAAIRQDIDPILLSAHPGFQLRYTEAIRGTPGSGTGIRMLLDGQLAFAQSSRPIEDKEYEQAKLRGFGLKQIPIALDGIAIAVHPKLAVSGLTLNQIRDIYTGKITNWRQVGGPNLTITAYSRRPADGGTPEYFVKEVLEGGSLGNNVKYVYTITDGIRNLINNPGSVYYASATEIVPQCGVKPLAIARLSNQFVSPYKEPLVPSENCPNQKIS